MSSVKKAGRPANEALWAQRTEEILDAAAGLFAERGYTDADTQELADRLGVGKGTIYRYFPSKQELFLAAVDRVMRRLQERVRDVTPDKDPLDQITVAIEGYLAFFEEHPQFAELLIQERAQFRDRKKPTYFEHREANLARWEALVRDLIKSGRMRNLAVEHVMEVMSDLVYGTMFTNYFTGRQRSFKTQARNILDVIFNGILSDTERQQRNAKR